MINEYICFKRKAFNRRMKDGGVVYDEQAHNDDEYDGTGALLGLAAGSLLSNKIMSPRYKGVQKRVEKRTGRKLNTRDLQTEATINKSFNSLLAAQDLRKKLFKRS